MRSDELWHSLDEEGGQTGGKHKKLTTVIQKGRGKLVQIHYNYCVSCRHKNIKIEFSTTFNKISFAFETFIIGFLVDSQVEALFPDRVEVPIDSLCPLLGFSNLNSYIRVAGACFIFSLKALGTHH